MSAILINCLLNLLSSQHLLVHSQQCKLQNNVWNMFQVNNKDTWTTSMTSFFCLCCELWTNFTCSSVSIVDFEQIDNDSVSWVTKFLPSKQMFKASNKGYFAPSGKRTLMWTCIKHSFLRHMSFWTSYLHLIYILWPGRLLCEIGWKLYKSKDITLLSVISLCSIFS